MKISAVIATFNRLAILQRTLPTVLEQDFPDEYEVVVVVDGSRDGTVEWLRATKFCREITIVEQANKGVAAARNAGIRAARGKLLLFLDDDLLCDRRLLFEHVEAHRRGLLVVTGPVLVAAESPSTLGTDWVRRCTDEVIRRLDQGTASWPDYTSVAANYSAPRELLLEYGGFDERFVGACEELEFGLRLKKAGVRFRYLPEAVTHQIYVKSAGSVVLKDGRARGKNEVLLCRKHPNYRPVSTLAQVGERPCLKRLLRNLVVRMPVSPEPFLRPSLKFVEGLSGLSLARRGGSRLFGGALATVFLRSAVRETGSWNAFRHEFAMSLPVLLYHHVGPARTGTDPELTVSPQRFESQMRWLAEHGYVGIRPSDWLAWCCEARPLPLKPVLITFDHGYADVARYALPILTEYRFSAAVYLVTRQIGGANTWDQANGLGIYHLMGEDAVCHWSSRGIEFGSHTRTHQDLRSLGDGELQEEIFGSSDDIERLTGARPLSFAYPYGAFNDRVREQAARAFNLAFTLDVGHNYLGTNLALLKRCTVRPSHSMTDFVCLVRLGWSPIDAIRGRLTRQFREALERRDPCGGRQAPERFSEANPARPQQPFDHQ